MFVELVKGAALLLALCFLHGANLRLWRRQPRVGKAFSGLLFGGICIVGMLSPLTIAPGVIIDARSVVLCMAGLVCMDDSFYCSSTTMCLGNSYCDSMEIS